MARNVDPAEAYKIARRRISAARRRPKPHSLDLSELGLTSLPPEIGQLTTLRVLNLNGNLLNKLPPETAQLTALERLYVAVNQFSKLPPELFKLKTLKGLDLGANQIKRVPPEIENLINLKSLYLAYNQIKALPREILALRSLELAAQADYKPYTDGLWIEENPLPDPYPRLIEMGQPEATLNVFAWLRGERDLSILDNPKTAEHEEQEEKEGGVELTDTDGHTELKKAMAQRPAAFRFGLRNGKIDALPEKANVSNLDVAKDLHAELVAKTDALRERLAQTNSDKRAQSSADRLIEALGTNLKDVRPGVLLSRARSIEADRNAFHTRQARRELFPEAISMMDDVLLSLEDLLAAFPAVREIEAEQLALAVQRDPAVIKKLQRETSLIKEAAATSEVVTDNAINALKEQDADIIAARNNTIRSRLLGDQLLVVRNFVGEAIRAGYTAGNYVAKTAGPKLRRAGTELGELGAESWQEIKKGLPRGAGTAARLLPTVALAGLLATIAGPVGGLAALSGSFKPLAKALRNFSGGRKRKNKKKAKTKPTTRKPKTPT